MTRYESQRRCEEWSVRVGMGREMVARVTVRVVTSYVNLPIWSILQSKRIGFLWRWISSAGKLSLCLYLSPPSSTYCTSHSGFFLFILLLMFPCVICHLTGFLKLSPSPLPVLHPPPNLVYLSGHIRDSMISCDIFQMPICLS